MRSMLVRRVTHITFSGEFFFFGIDNDLFLVILLACIFNIPVLSDTSLDILYARIKNSISCCMSD